jgi:hypothetical protein
MQNTCDSEDLNLWVGDTINPALEILLPYSDLFHKL